MRSYTHLTRRQTSTFTHVDTQTCTHMEGFRGLHKGNIHLKYTRAKTGMQRDVHEHKYVIYTYPCHHVVFIEHPQSASHASTERASDKSTGKAPS